MTATRELPVGGMHCASCGLLIDEAVEELQGVRRCSTEVRRGRARVEYDPAVTTLEVIASAIAGLGYTCVAPDERSS